jgi:hypothetical protein
MDEGYTNQCNKTSCLGYVHIDNDDDRNVEHVVEVDI